MAKRKKQTQPIRKSFNATSLHNNVGAHNGRRSLPREGLLPPAHTRKPRIFTKNIFAIIILNFLVTSILISLTIYVASQYGNRDNTTTKTTTAEAQIDNATVVTYVQGDAEYYLNQVWVPLSTSQKIGESDSIRTLANARLIISLPDGSTIRMAGDTTITFTRLKSTEVIITNQAGRLYARVLPNLDRVFRIDVDDSEFSAVGTAYEVLNTEFEKGVRVYENTVKTRTKQVNEQLITTGQQYYVAHEDSAKTLTVTNLDGNELANDEFVLWNKQQDSADPAYKHSLGFLETIGLTQYTSTDSTNSTQTFTNTGGQGITLYGTKSTEGIKLNWTTNALDTQWGFKVVYSATDTTPSFKESGSTAEFASKEASSAFVSLTDGKTWYFRICAYRANDTCLSYSNAVSVTAPLKVKAKVIRGAMNATLENNTLSWTYTGSATYGYKINWNTSGSPTYPPEAGSENAGSVYIANKYETSLNLANKLSEPGTYYLNVCAYTDGTEATACVDYTNTITYTK